MVVDISNNRYGRLLVINRIKGDYWECLCDCGAVCKKRASHLKCGVSKSCGCLNREICRDRFTVHGLGKHPLRGIHNAMMQRCYNKNQKAYKHYGGRGILVCERWHTFKNFYDDMVVGYETGLSIERINVNGNYEATNCKWATKKEQARNTTANVFIEANGVKRTMSEWAEILGLDKRTVWARIDNGWSAVKAVTTPKTKKSKVSRV